MIAEVLKELEYIHEGEPPPTTRALIAALREAIEGLNFYSNIIDTKNGKTKADGFFVKRPIDDKWFSVMNPARKSLANITEILGKIK